MELLKSYNATGENSTKTASPSEKFENEPRILIAAIVEVVISIVGSTGNLLTCLAVIRNNSLQFATNFFIVSLAVADLLVCTILVPMRASQHFSFFLGKGDIHYLAVKVAGFLGRVNIVASICSLAALSIDRCIAIKYPMRYRFDIRYATRRVLGVIFAFWAFAIVFTSLPYVPGITDDVFLIGFIVFVLFVTFIIILAYFRIFHVANMSRKRRKVGAIDIDLEEGTSKHKKNKKSFHVHFSTNSSCSHDVSSSRYSDKPTKTQSRNSLVHKSACGSLQRVAPKAKPSFPEEITKTLAQTGEHAQMRLCKGPTQVSEVPETENRTSTIHTRDIADEHVNTNENASYGNANKEKDMVKMMPRLSRGRRHSSALPTTSSHTAYNKNTQSAFAISSTCKDISVTTSTILPNKPADLSMKKTGLSSKHFDPSPSYQGILESSSKTKLGQYMEPTDTFPYEFDEEKPSKIEQTKACDEKTHGSIYLQHNAQRMPRNSSKIELLDVQATSASKPRLQKDSNTDMTKRINANINSQESSNSLQGDLRKVRNNCAIKDLQDKQLNQGHATNYKLDTTQNPSSQDSEEQRRIRKDRRKDHKTTKTIGIVIGGFIALVYPRIIMILYHYGNKATPASLLARFWVRILLYTNSAVNPLLYAWRMREFRNEFSKMIFALFRCGKIQSHARIHPSQAITIQSTTALSTDVAATH